MSKKEIREKALLFLKNRKNANNLVEIIILLEQNEKSIQSTILALEIIFLELLKRKEMVDNIGENDDSLEVKYRHWLQECYDDAFTKLTHLLTKHNQPVQKQALSTIMKLVAQEGKYPIKPTDQKKFNFPVHRLQPVVLALLSSEHNTSHLIARFQEFTAYKDVSFHVWKLLLDIAQTRKRPNCIFIRNFLDLMDKVPLSSKSPVPVSENVDDAGSSTLCGVEGGATFTMNKKALRKCVNQVWNHTIRWEHSHATHRQLLVVLLERVLEHLDKPMLLTDYLMDSMDIGGPVSLLALQGIFILIQTHNLDYPNIYAKLYSMFDADIFTTRYKARLFYLADIFLSSTHLPALLVAAFVKRLARLCLVAPPQDIHIMILFIGNLILRHPQLKGLINHPTGGEVTCDPYLAEERDPTKSRAMESSLWELAALQHHVLPSVATAARFINSPLPSVEWDMSNILENTADDIFDKEGKKKMKEMTLTFERPHSMNLPRGEKLSQYWKLT
uniref:CCAAT-binding factor domain-containing protein n=1 Tax=Timema poppense TaxID=170557 RepID=A0A7R9GZI6_TIMPO|nr:unnamed protein product [Timema poppensis]